MLGIAEEKWVKGSSFEISTSRSQYEGETFRITQGSTSQDLPSVPLQLIKSISGAQV